MGKHLNEKYNEDMPKKHKKVKRIKIKPSSSCEDGDQFLECLENQPKSEQHDLFFSCDEIEPKKKHKSRNVTEEIPLHIKKEKQSPEKNKIIKEDSLYGNVSSDINLTTIKVEKEEDLGIFSQELFSQELFSNSQDQKPHSQEHFPSIKSSHKKKKSKHKNLSSDATEKMPVLKLPLSTENVKQEFEDEPPSLEYKHKKRKKSKHKNTEEDQAFDLDDSLKVNIKYEDEPSPSEHTHKKRKKSKHKNTEETEIFDLDDSHKTNFEFEDESPSSEYKHKKRKKSKHKNTEEDQTFDLDESLKVNIKYEDEPSPSEHTHKKRKKSKHKNTEETEIFDLDDSHKTNFDKRDTPSFVDSLENKLYHKKKHKTKHERSPEKTGVIPVYSMLTESSLFPDENIMSLENEPPSYEYKHKKRKRSKHKNTEEDHTFDSHNSLKDLENEPPSSEYKHKKRKKSKHKNTDEKQTFVLDSSFKVNIEFEDEPPSSEYKHKKRKKSKHKNTEEDQTFDLDDSLKVNIEQEERHSQEKFLNINSSHKKKKSKHKNLSFDVSEIVAVLKSPLSTENVKEDESPFSECKHKKMKKSKHKNTEEDQTCDLDDSHKVNMNKEDTASVTNSENKLLHKKKGKAIHDESFQFTVAESSSFPDENIKIEEHNDILTSLGLQLTKQTAANNITEEVSLDERKENGSQRQQYHSSDSLTHLENYILDNIDTNTIKTNTEANIEGIGQNLFSNEKETNGNISNSSSAYEYAYSEEEQLKVRLDKEMKKFINLKIVLPKAVPILHAVDRCRLFKGGKSALEYSGSHKTGAWEKSEKDILKKNCMNFQKEYGINNWGFLTKLHPSIYRINSYQQAKINFLRYLGQGLPDRTLESIDDKFKNIYLRNRRKKENRNHKFTAKEDEIILQHVKNYGCDWIKLGKIMKMYPPSLRDRYRIINKIDKIVLGKWSESEDEKLIEIIREVVGEENFVYYNHKTIYNLPWEHIAQLMETRSARQCRARWMNTLYRILSSGDFIWTKDKDTELIKELKKLNIESNNETNWPELSFKLKLPVPNGSQNRWFHLKRSVVDHTKKSIKECLDILEQNLC